MLELFRPNKTNLLKWVEALESGDYKQGRRHNTQNIEGTEYDCCLGVGNKVAILNGVGIEVSGTGITSYDGNANGLCDAAADFFGIDANPTLDFATAVFRNDDLHEDFRTIAAAIRKEYELGPATEQQD